MKSAVLLSALGALALGATTAGAQEITGRVISSVPVIQQVQVPRQVCSNQPVAVQQPRSGAGAAIGALAGGLLGNTVGGGSGRAAATVLGVVGGAVVGDRVEGNNGGAQIQNMQQCTTQTTLENRTVGYNVTYEVSGRQYMVQMPNDPGPTVRLQVTPVGAAPMQNDGYVQSQQAVVMGPATVQSVVVPTTVYPAYAPYPYYRPYYPVAFSFGLGYYGGGHHGGGHHHWR